MESTSAEILEGISYQDLILKMGFPMSKSRGSKEKKPYHCIDVEILPPIKPSNVQIYWYNIGRYILTMEAIWTLHYDCPGFRLASPAEFLAATIKLRPIGPTRICLFEIDTFGQGRSGFAALTANENIQRTASSFTCGDGFGRHCLFAVVPIGA
ncbi:MAG: hypothetical protein Q8O75_00240 [bacterium]|nr:hypothetical protein [bacterium]